MATAPGWALTTEHRFRDDRISGSAVRAELGDPDDSVGARSALRVVPLLAVVDDGRSGTGIVLGSSAVLVGRTPAGQPTVTVRTTVQAVWFETAPRSGHFAVQVERDAPLPPDHRLHAPLDRFVQDALGGVPGRVVLGTRAGSSSSSSPSADDVVAAAAKALAEASRETVARLREVRYDLEAQLAVTSGGGGAGSQHTSVVSALLQLNIVCGRSRDLVREIEREGLWLHVTDSEAYHASRRLQDPRLLIEIEPATATLRSWMRQHDAAMRQCAALQTQLEEETASLRSLLASAASISNSKEADAQSRFNVIAAIASIGLGLPALVLTLYGATVLLPMDGARLVLFLPVVAALLIAAVIAIWQGVAMKHGRIWVVAAVGILVFVGVLLWVAGWVASPFGLEGRGL
ncbi:MAG: hypothetical protein Q7T71_02280 [Herbiconiux sp.]|nr:hypothetical protein [Herbiconiux sp.]